MAERLFRPNEAELCDIERLAGLGLLKYQIRNYFQVSKKRWDASEKRDLRIERAFNRGQAVYTQKAAGKLMEHIEKGNLKAIMYYLERRSGWSKNYDPEAGVNIVEPAVSINVSDPQEAARIYQDIMTRGK